jgi:hypothetical protein
MSGARSAERWMKVIGIRRKVEKIDRGPLTTDGSTRLKKFNLNNSPRRAQRTWRIIELKELLKE